MKRRNTFRAALALLLILTLCMPAAASGFTEKLIAITFDDGPGAYTAQLLRFRLPRGKLPRDAQTHGF